MVEDHWYKRHSEIVQILFRDSEKGIYHPNYENLKSELKAIREMMDAKDELTQCQERLAEAERFLKLLADSADNSGTYSASDRAPYCNYCKQINHTDNCIVPKVKTFLGAKP